MVKDNTLQWINAVARDSNIDPGKILQKVEQHKQDGGKGKGGKKPGVK